MLELEYHEPIERMPNNRHRDGSAGAWPEEPRLFARRKRSETMFERRYTQAAKNVRQRHAEKIVRTYPEDRPCIFTDLDNSIVRNARRNERPVRLNASRNSNWLLRAVLEINLRSGPAVDLPISVSRCHTP